MQVEEAKQNKTRMDTNMKFMFGKLPSTNGTFTLGVKDCTIKSLNTKLLN